MPLPRRWRRNQKGQAMPLAAVGLFIMTLGVLATLNLGQAVYQKIQLQNTADSAAYSLAAMEARTFNYIAFLNRAQIAHYNSAMVVQSFMTWIGFEVALAATSTDLLITLKNAVQAGTQYPYPANVPYVAVYGILEAMAQIFSATRSSISTVLKLMEREGHNFVEAMSIFNKSVVWQCQLARAVLLNGHLTTAMMSYVHKNDPDIQFGSGGAGGAFNLGLNAALNSIEYFQSFSSGPGVNPQWVKLLLDYQRVLPSGAYIKVSDEGAEDAYRVMAELCHATRSPRKVSDRSGTGIATRGVVFLSGDKKGQTRFTKEGEVQDDSAEIRAISSEGSENYVLPKHLSSDDYLDTAIGFGFMVGVVQYTGTQGALGDAIDAYEEEGAHYKYKASDDTSGGISPTGRIVIAFPPPNGDLTIRTEEKDTDDSGTGSSGHARWPGFAPYFAFNPSSDRTKDFNQPSTWMILNKSHKQFQTDSGSPAPWYQNFTWINGVDANGNPLEKSLDTTIGGKRNSYLFEGINVISRGMAYYHRPGDGNWKEHPNFFNPFWNARLAPVGQKLQQFWDRWVTQKIGTSSESTVVQALVSVLKGALNDTFTGFVTALITH